MSSSPQYDAGGGGGHPPASAHAPPATPPAPPPAGTGLDPGAAGGEGAAVTARAARRGLAWVSSPPSRGAPGSVDGIREDGCAYARLWSGGGDRGDVCPVPLAGLVRASAWRLVRTGGRGRGAVDGARSPVDQCRCPLCSRPLTPD